MNNKLLLGFAALILIIILIPILSSDQSNTSEVRDTYASPTVGESGTSEQPDSDKNIANTYNNDV